MRTISVISLSLLFSCALSAQSVHMRNGDRLYKEKKYTQALVEYEKAAGENDHDAVVDYNLADAYFRNEKYDEAEKTYDKLLNGNDVAMQQRAWYNKGVSLSKQKKLEESITAYKNALLLDPADSDARINLQKALLELKKKQDPEKDKNQEQNENQNKKQAPPTPQSKLNKKQVEQLLKALDQREQQVQQKMMRQNKRGVTKPDKDW